MKARQEETLERSVLTFEGDVLRCGLRVAGQHSTKSFWVRLFTKDTNVSHLHFHGKTKVHGNRIESPEIRDLKANTEYRLIFRHTQFHQVIDSITTIDVKKG